jgi:hypothetical protein
MVKLVPQITCPKCGMTINLENRKGVDFNLIENATKKGSKTFTELLHITKLSRKTLSLRLKELCEKGVLVKNAGAYGLNGGFNLENACATFATGSSKVIHDKRIRTGLMLMALLLFSSASGYVLAALISRETRQEPTILGDFTMALDVNNVDDLYAWQVAITFNSSEIKVLKITPGGFLGSDFPFFLNATDVDDGILLLGGSLQGEVPGKSGSGRLATIVFGYFVNKYREPAIALNGIIVSTLLINSKGSYIPFQDSTLTLYIIEK